MDPVNSPAIFLGRCIAMGAAGRDNNKRTRLQCIIVLLYLGLALSLEAIDQDMLIAAMRALPVMIFCFRIITDIGNIHARCYGIAVAELSNDLPWQYD